MAIFAINIYMGVSSGSVYVEGTEGQKKIGSVSLQWAIGRVVLFMYIIYPITIQIIQWCMAFCCPPKLKDAPLTDGIIEKQYREYRIKQERERTLRALQAECHNRNLAIKKQVAIETIRLKHAAFATEAERQKAIRESAERIKAQLRESMKKDIDEKYAKLKKIHDEKAKLIRAGKYTVAKQEALNEKQQKLEKITPVVLETEPTGLFTEETQPTKRKVPALKTTEPGIKKGGPTIKDPLSKPARRGSIDSKTTGKTAATKLPNKATPKRDTSPQKPQQVSPERGASPQKQQQQASPQRGEPPKNKYIPGMRTKMKVPTFNKPAGKGPLRIPPTYKFANERLAK